MAPDSYDISDMTPARRLADIEAMVRREGGLQYCAQDMRMGFCRAQLCGVQAHLLPKAGICRLYTHDTDIMIGRDGNVHFLKGNANTLKAWHHHLHTYRKIMRTGSSGAMAA